MEFTKREKKHLAIAIFIIAFVLSFNEWGTDEFNLATGILNLLRALFFTSIILIVHQLAQKKAASNLDCKTEYRIWQLGRFRLLETGKKPRTFYLLNKQYQLPKLPLGIIIPLFVSLFSAGKLFFVGVGGFNIKELTTRRAGRLRLHVTEYELGKIAYSGILVELGFLFLFKLILPLAPTFFEKGMFISASLAIFNMLPIPPLDGSKVFFGGNIFYLFLLTLTLIYSLTIFILNPFLTVFISLLLAFIIAFLFAYKVKKLGN